MILEELNLNKPLLNALADLEYEYATPIQEMAFAKIMSGKNVIGVAQTGTGKTFAYLLPILRMLKYSKQRDPRVLIIAPTHELVIQIEREIQKLTKYSNIRSLGVFGGGNINKQKQAVYDGSDILVATPGRLLDIAYTAVLSLKSVKHFIIDEVDEMLSLGFRVQINNILEQLPPKRQTLMFSATLTKEVEELINNSIPRAEKIEIAPHGTPIDKIVQKAFHVPNFDTKVSLLKILLSEDKEISKVLVFVKTKKIADKLFTQINLDFPEQIAVIHSNKAHNTRMAAVNKFDDGLIKVLIATDVVARGMDMKDVTHIVNFDLPETVGEYIHRIGRTGRADKNGVAISFINEVEMIYQQEIEEVMNMKIPMVELPNNIVISNKFADDEKPSQAVKVNYPKLVSQNSSKGAFHEKSAKNLKTNSGSPAKKKQKVYSKSGKLKYRKNK